MMRLVRRAARRIARVQQQQQRRTRHPDLINPQEKPDPDPNRS